MRIFGISSATKVISIGLVDDDQVLAESTVKALNAEKLISLAKQAGVKPESIEAIAVVGGPGSYSGLRGGMAVAKTLAQVKKIPIIAISTLEAMAFNLIEIEGLIAVILDAKGSEHNFALFAGHNGKLKRLTSDLVLEEKALVAKLGSIKGDLWLCGNLDFSAKIKWDKNIHLADTLHGVAYGINVAKLGAIKLANNEESKVLELVPKYSHQPNIRKFTSSSK